MDNLEEQREAILSGGDSEQTVDKPAESNDNSGTEDNGRDLSQSEIPESFRKEYGIPGEYKSIADVLKGYKELNSFRGRRENEFGEIRAKNQELENKYNQLLQSIKQIGNNKNPEQLEQEFLETLQKDPRSGIRQVAIDAIREQYEQKLEALNKEIEDMKNWRTSSQIAMDKDNFIRNAGFTADDEKELAEIIAEKPEFFRRFDSTADILEAASIKLAQKRQMAAAKNKEQVQATEEKKEKATVLSTTNARPAKQTGKTVEEMREEILANITR